jgi:hypothetical protein
LASAAVSLSYQQTRRLSYVVSGSGFLTRYSYLGAIGASGVTGAASAFYRVTPRDSVGLTYSHGYYAYQRGAGSDQVDTIGGSYSHQFANHWLVSGFAGVSRSNATGTVSLPLSLLIGQEGVGGYVLGTYRNVQSLPSISGSVSHNYRRMFFSATGGEGVAAGNGYYLTSKAQFITGTFSQSYRRSNFAVAGTYSRLFSVSNTVSAAYKSSGLSAQYSRNLYKYLGANVRYDFFQFGTLSPYPSYKDNRISFGLTFSSQSIPLTLY